MSTAQAVSVPTPEAKKSKKEKKSADGSAKKRKREEESTNGATVEPVVKKPKKEKSQGAGQDGEAVATPSAPTVPQEMVAQLATNGTTPQGSAKKSKKRKSDVAAQDGIAAASSSAQIAQPAAATEPAINGATDPGSTKKSKKSKKRKSEGAGQSSAAAVESSAQVAQPATVAEPEVNGMTAEGAAKKSKKNKKPTADDESAKSGIPAAQPAEPTPAKKRKPKKTDNKLDKGKGTIIAPSTASSSKAQSLPVADSATSDTPFNDDLLKTHSPLAQETHSLYLPLSPCANAFPLEGLVAEHISPLLLTYYPPLKGVVLSYSNARLSESPGERSGRGQDEDEVVLSKAIDEYAVTFVWLTVDFVLLKPKRGCYLEGYVNLQNESLLGVMVWNYFSAAIDAQRLPKSWRWIEGEMRENGYAPAGKGGYWIDENGEKVDGRLVFRLRDFDASGSGEQGVGTISIEGTLLSAKEDGKVDEAERQKATGGSSKRTKVR